MKIIKQEVTAKSRTLKASWTMEKAQDVEYDTSVDIEKLLSEILQREIDNEILRKICVENAWTKVVVPNHKKISKDWCAQYIKNKYNNFDNEWFFEDERDATFFSLKWSSEK